MAALQQLQHLDAPGIKKLLRESIHLVADCASRSLTKAFVDLGEKWTH
ncbi:hypothetical protein [Sedimenticola sp.]